MREESMHTRLCGWLLESEFGLTVLFGDGVVTLDQDGSDGIRAKVKHETVHEVKQRQQNQRSEK
jgi:hypothetical protein